eukprot:scaffold245_cov256-Pinguiococcus_pyrenoidosus.AAC.46
MSFSRPSLARPCNCARCPLPTSWWSAALHHRGPAVAWRPLRAAAKACPAAPQAWLCGFTRLSRSLAMRQEGYRGAGGERGHAKSNKGTLVTRKLPKSFFSKAPEDVKASCVSRKIYCNERDVPMWYLGYERQPMRECLRLHTGSLEAIPWPNESFPRLKPSALELVKQLQRICDRMLSVLLGDEVSAMVAEDYSVCYSFHYPNEATRDAALPIHVGEHRDPSLFVAEPVARIPGLEVLDEATESWIPVEESCTSFSDVVLFCGKALANWTRGTSAGIPALRHRVVGEPLHRRRVSIVFEQKYGEFYDPSAGYLE